MAQVLLHPTAPGELMRGVGSLIGYGGSYDDLTFAVHAGLGRNCLSDPSMIRESGSEKFRCARSSGTAASFPRRRFPPPPAGVPPLTRGGGKLGSGQE